MPRFFLPSSSFETDEVLITGADAAHISRSLRMKTGDPITLCDMRQNEYSCLITAITSDSVTVRVCRVSRSVSEPPCFITLYQAIAKGDKMDTVIQKAVELGACRIVPVRMDRCIAKIAPDAEAGKITRWQRISAEAAGQCGRGVIPEVCAPVGFSQAIEWMKGDDISFVCYEGDGTRSLCDILESDTPERISFLIGPEGGISQSEVALAGGSGIALAGLGKRILRTETASGYVLSCLSFRYEIGGLTEK